jgi:hypothetical protein
VNAFWYLIFIFPVLTTEAAEVSLQPQTGQFVRSTPQTIQRQLLELNRRLEDERDQLVHSTVGEAGIAQSLENYDPSGLSSAQAKKGALGQWQGRRQLLVELQMQTALLAEQLQRYKETGILSPTSEQTARRIASVLKIPWERWDGRKPLNGFRPAIHVGRRTQADGSLAETQKARLPTTKESPLLRFESDAGRGRWKGDPVPDLIQQLSSALPRERAIAAEALADLGPDAVKALPNLRRTLFDGDPRVRSSSAQALGAIGKSDADIKSDLRRALVDKDLDVRLSAKKALERLR